MTPRATTPRATTPPAATRPGDDLTIQIEQEGRTVASAEVRPTGEPGVVHSDLHAEAGRLPDGTRARLVDAVLEHPQVDEAERLLATMPLGDTEMLDRVRQRCGSVEAHAAGATKIVDARLPHRE
jgi:hypothetical protein